LNPFLDRDLILILSERMARDRGNDDSSSDGGSNENDNKKEKKPKSRKPPNTAFRQQRLLAYAPILTPKTVLPLFFAIGIIFGPIGGLLLFASSKVAFVCARHVDRPGPRDYHRLYALCHEWKHHRFHKYTG
jgi:hypothetical protein